MRLRTIRAQVTAFFAAAAALSVAAAMLTRSSHDHTVSALDAAKRSQALVRRLTQMGRHLAAMQASQRGYVITGSAAELDRYHAESRQFDDQLAAARKEMPGAHGLQRLTRFDARIRDWREVSRRLIELRTAGRDVSHLIATQATPRFAEDARRLIDGAQNAMTATAAVGALLGLMLRFAAQRRLIEPLATLAASARRLARGDYAAQLPKRRPDEIGVLTDAFADMRTAVQERIEASHAANAELLAILDTVPAGIVLLDSSGALRLQNVMATQFPGRPSRGRRSAPRLLEGLQRRCRGARTELEERGRRRGRRLPGRDRPARLVSGAHWISQRLALTYAAGWHRQDPFYDRLEFQVGLRRRF